MKTKDILKLRPVFKIGNNTIVDWFEVTDGVAFYYIRSGLRHADGETKSPFYCEMCVVGKNAKKKALKQFNIWWNNL